MIVVTGASGLLGASVLLCARDLGREVVGLCHSHVLRISGVTIHKIDLTNGEATRVLIRKLNPKVIIHCAAAANVDWCEDHPHEAEQINVQASSVLAQLAAELNAAFIYVSTDSVFDGEQGGYSESDEPRPINVYAMSKLRGEDEVLRYKSDAIIVRINIYGWNAQDKQSLAEWFLERLKAEKKVPGFTDVFFCPMLVNDLADILIQILDAQLSGVYHVVAPDKISKYEFGRRVALQFGLDPNLVITSSLSQAKLRAARPRDVSLSTAKIESALGRRMPDITSGLARFQALDQNGYARRLKQFLAGACA